MMIMMDNRKIIEKIESQIKSLSKDFIEGFNEDELSELDHKLRNVF